MNREVWEKHYKRKKSYLSIPDENVVRSVIRYLNKNPDGVFLDAGCGKGRHFHFMRQYTDKVFGMDFTKNSLRDIEDGSEIHKLLLGDISQIPFKSNSFDYVLAWGIIHYLPQNLIETTIKELYRIIKPGGVLFLTFRSDQDTHLKTVIGSGDLSGGHYLTFSREDTLKLCSQFSQIFYGYLERIIPEDIKSNSELKKVAHHMLELVK